MTIADAASTALYENDDFVHQAADYNSLRFHLNLESITPRPENDHPL
jgi:hypothetical protein